MKLNNEYLDKIEQSGDHFHHLGFDTKTIDLKSVFADVKVVCLSGSAGRITKFAHFLNDHLKVYKNVDEIVNMCNGDRYVMYKIGHVLVANHGMGVPSTSIILHELFKLLHYSGVSDAVFFRIGTSGGLGVEPGTVVLTKRAVNGLLQPKHRQVVLGNVVEYDTTFSEELVQEMTQLTHTMEEKLPFNVEVGDTMCCDCFYEGQARLDGAFVSYTEKDKIAFLQKAYDQGIRNIEMESSVFAAMCGRARIKACVVCVVFLDRLLHDQITLTSEVRKEHERRPWYLVLEYIKKHSPV